MRNMIIMLILLNEKMLLLNLFHETLDHTVTLYTDANKFMIAGYDYGKGISKYYKNLTYVPKRANCYLLFWSFVFFLQDFMNDYVFQLRYIIYR